jgi:hypothetical protein
MKHLKCSVKEEPYHHNPNFKIPFLGLQSYNIPAGPVHESPCMSLYWRKQELRKGKKREEE